MDVVFFLFFRGYVRAETICAPYIQRVPGVLRRPVLDNVEAAHVRVHRLYPGLERGRRVRQGVPASVHPHHRIRQRPSGPVHQFHCLHAPWFQGITN